MNMKKHLTLAGIVAGLLTVGGIAFASSLPSSVPATFETYLANQQSSVDTTATLANGTIGDGTTFTGYQCVTVDANTPTQEYECGTANGTSLTNLTRGLDYVMGTSSLVAKTFAHRRGADVKISDYPVLTLLDRISGGIDSFPALLSYPATLATSSLAGNNIPDAAWVLNQTQAVTSVSNADGTLTISPTIGPVVASLTLSHGNVWNTASTTFAGGLTSLTGTTTNATSTTIFSTTASTTSLFVGGSIALGTTSPNVALSISDNQSILVTENKVSTSTSQTLDWRKGNQQLMQIGNSAITVTQTNMRAGQHLLVVVCNPAAGTAGTITWSGVEWAGQTQPTQITTANFCDAWSFISTNASSTNGTAKIFGTAATGFN